MLRASLLLIALVGCGGRGERNPDDGSGLCEDRTNPELEAELARVLALPPDTPPSAEQLARIRGLSPNGLKSLEGVQCLTNLVQLGVTNATVTDLSPLMELRSLATLEIRNSTPPDVTTLRAGSVAQVTTLRIIRSDFRELAELEVFSSLVTLDLSGNGLTELAAVPSLVNLEELVLNENALSDLSELETYPALEVLSVNDNELTTLRSINDHPTLSQLKAANNRITSLGDLRQSVLHTLEVYSNPLNELGSLRGVPGLRSLGLGATGLGQLAGLEAVPYLTHLSLQDNPVSDLANLALLPELEELNLTRTSVSDLSPLSSLKDVRILELEASNVVSLGGLQPWSTLRGSCRRVGVAELALDAASLGLARKLCESGWDVTPVCQGLCDPHP